MWAEITIRTNKDMPSDLQVRLAKYFQDHLSDTKGALEKTTLNVDLLSQVLLARRSKEAITLVLNPDLQKLKAHIDNSVGSKTLEPLKREIDAFHEDLKRFLKTCDAVIQELTVLIGAEGDTLYVGQRLNFWDRLMEAFKENVMAKLYVPLATYLASLATGLDQHKAVLNVVTALVALLLWMFFDAAILRRPLTYKG